MAIFRCCPRATQAEGLNGYIISRLTQGFSIRCLRFTSDVAASHARLASGWRARLYREGVEPSGSLRKVSGYIPFSFPGLRLSQGWSTPSDLLADQRQCSPICRRYTHRVAISNCRLTALDERGVTYRYKDYRRDGAERYRTMTISTGEFIRRFMLHVLPKGFHRIRHYGLLASAGRRAKVAASVRCSRCRQWSSH